MKSVTIDRAKRLRDEPHTGHNRWHPDVPPILEVEPGEEVFLETRDAADGQIGPGVGVDILERRDKKVGHTREQAYVICSVAVDLRVSNVVDLPNVTVAALLPEAIFQG